MHAKLSGLLRFFFLFSFPVRFIWTGNVFLNVLGWGLYTVCGMWATGSFASGERSCVPCTRVGQGKGYRDPDVAL